ncbi:MAG: hypothetical protein CGW95_15075 [Phenylobacterium zucineum]|nr:MAG: hypothetical protein CGW95_15075 [Phenylobacterium zucineum]
MWKPADNLLQDIIPTHPISGYYLDWLLKETAFSSNWDPHYLPHLDLRVAGHRFHLTSYLRSLAASPNLPSELVQACTGAGAWLSLMDFHPSLPYTFPAWNPIWSSLVGLPTKAYTLFSSDLLRYTIAPELRSHMLGWGLCILDTRFSLGPFNYSELETLAAIPNYGIHTPRGFMPLKPPLSAGGMSRPSSGPFTRSVA